MLRPIQITPITDQTPIRQTLIPNTMSQEQFMANQLAGNNVQLQQPVSPVQGLVATGQEGLQGAERISKQIAKSPRVQGLLGSGDSSSGLLGNIQGEAALQGLFATMQAIGRPVRRGEDRFMGATQYGQQVMNQAQQRGLQDLSTRMQLEKFAQEKQIADARSAALAGMAAPDAVNLGQSFTEYELQQMSPAQKSLATQAEALRQRGLQLMAVDPSSQIGKELLDQSKQLRENSLTGVRDRTEQAQEEKNLRVELAPSLKAANEVASKHNSLIALTDKAMQGSFVSGYGAVVQALKSLEPNSAVLSSEYDSATSLAGVLSQAIQLFEGAKGRMTPEMAQSLRDVAAAAAETAMEVRSSVEAQYAPIVESNFLRPDNVFLKPIPLKTAPQVFDFGGASQRMDDEEAAKSAAEELIGNTGGGA